VAAGVAHLSRSRQPIARLRPGGVRSRGGRLTGLGPRAMKAARHDTSSVTGGRHHAAMSPTGRRAPVSRPEPNTCFLLGCFIVGLPLVGILLLAASFGVSAAVDRLVSHLASIIPGQVMATLMGVFFVLVGMTGVYGIATGTSAASATRSKRLLGLVLCVGFGLLGLVVLAEAFDPSAPQSRF
jgi:hypothetical protein